MSIFARLRTLNKHWTRIRMVIRNSYIIIYVACFEVCSVVCGVHWLSSAVRFKIHDHIWWNCSGLKNVWTSEDRNRSSRTHHFQLVAELIFADQTAQRRQTSCNFDPNEPIAWTHQRTRKFHVSYVALSLANFPANRTREFDLAPMKKWTGIPRIGEPRTAPDKDLGSFSCKKFPTIERLECTYIHNCVDISNRTSQYLGLMRVMILFRRCFFTVASARRRPSQVDKLLRNMAH